MSAAEACEIVGFCSADLAVQRAFAISQRREAASVVALESDLEGPKVMNRNRYVCVPRDPSAVLNLAMPWDEYFDVLEIGAEQVDALDRLAFWDALGQACDVIIDDFEEDEVASKHVAKGMAVVCGYLGRPGLGTEVERTLLDIEKQLELAHRRGASVFLAG